MLFVFLCWRHSALWTQNTWWWFELIIKEILKQILLSRHQNRQINNVSDQLSLYWLINSVVLVSVRVVLDSVKSLPAAEHPGVCRYLHRLVCVVTWAGRWASVALGSRSERGGSEPKSFSWSSDCGDSSSSVLTGSWRRPVSPNTATNHWSSLCR